MTSVHDQFKKRLDRLGQLVMRARSHYDIWWAYQGPEHNSAWVAALRELPDFFRFDEHAQFVTLVMYLGQLFESRPGTINLPLAAAHARLAEFPESVVANADSALAKAQPLWKKVVVLRSNLFAHRSEKLSYEAAFKKA